MDKKEENEIKLVAGEKVQAKLLASLQGNQRDDLIDTIKATFGLGDYSVDSQQVELIVDEYFDTDDLDLHGIRTSFRVRRESGRVQVTIKKSIEQEQGQFKRIELTNDISEDQYANSVKTGFSQILRKELPAFNEKTLVKILIINNKRTSVLVERGFEKYLLSIDVFTYINSKTGQRSNPQSEVEIEALTDKAKAKLSHIRRNLTNVLKGFSYSKASKYDRGIQYFSLDRARFKEQCIFIGHGRSPLWLRLQAVLEKDLCCKTLSYESESRVGDSIIPILEEMMNQATFAVLVLTAEDETAEGGVRARQNVVHEAGLFQGRLGFHKVVLLVEDKIDNFSNVDGLQHIRFRDNNIEHTFWELQKALRKAKVVA